MMPPPRHHHLDGWTNNNNNNMVNIKNFPLLDVAAWLHIKIYSSTHVIEVELYKEFCAETKKVILTAFNENEESWIYLTPTVHALLELSGELIEANNGRGLGAYTEFSLESNNTVLRLTRVALSRKTN